MKMKNELSLTPLQTWGAESIYQEAMRAARRWRSEPAFNSGGPLDYVEDRAQEVVCHAWGYIKKRGFSEEELCMDQVTLFHRIAEYSKFGMIQRCYAVKTNEIFADEASDEDARTDNASGCTEDAEHEERDQETRSRIKEIFRAVGITDADWAIFGDANSDLTESLGVCPREVRNIKSDRSKAIIKRFEKLGLLGEIKSILGVRQLNKLNPI
ncbi:MAG: hypothetical protein B7X30_08270 [Thiomonas sp. 13-64-67]|jgi:hypothetical protein|nr:MAG: hypothetical protein B7X30_08270 [Thiomonas sp. 13-64-67]